MWKERLCPLLARCVGGDCAILLGGEGKAWRPPANGAHRRDKRIVQTATKQCIEIFREFVNHWFLKEVTVKEKGSAVEKGERP